MTEQHKRILDKVARLLALADAERNDNANERATALRQAQALMDKHGVDAAQLDAHAQEDSLGELGQDTHNVNSARWRPILINGIAKLYGVKMVRSGPDIHLFGRAVYRATVWAMSQYCIESIERETTKVSGRKAKTDFRNGAVHGVCDTVEAIIAERNAKARQPGTGLVLADHYQQHKRQAVAIRDQVFPRLTTGRSSARSSASYYAGRRHGQGISLNTQVGGARAVRITHQG